MNFIKTAALLALLFCLSLPLSAQEFFKMNTSGGGFNLLLGKQSFRFGDYFQRDSLNLSGALEKNLKEKYRDSAYFGQPVGALNVIGFQGFGINNSLVMGGELRVGLTGISSGKQLRFDSTGKQVKEGITQTRGFGMNVMASLGYIVLRKRGLIVYPLVSGGLGLSGVHINNKADTRIYPKVAGIVTETSSNIQNIGVWTSSPSLDFGLGAAYYIGRSTEDNAKGVCLGFRLGYNMQFTNDNIKVNWFKNAKDNIDWRNPQLPKVGVRGFYAMLTIGFGRAGENL